jgi:hypothetical protein
VSCEAKDGVGAWAKTIAQSPVLLDYTLAPISDLVEDPDVKAALDTAVKEYLKEKSAAWGKVDKCPVNCGPPGAGSCSKGASECTCSYDGIIGRQCTGCAPVSVKAKYKDPQGVTSSATATVPCDGKFVQVFSGNHGGLCTAETQVGRTMGKCQCDMDKATVSCARNALGNLQVKTGVGVCSCMAKGSSGWSPKKASCSGSTKTGGEGSKDKIDENPASLTSSKLFNPTNINKKKLTATCSFRL